MSGFLRQLASRGLGLAPRLRSAPSARTAALRASAAPPPWAASDAWAADPPIAAPAQAGMAASARAGDDGKDAVAGMTPMQPLAQYPSARHPLARHPQAAARGLAGQDTTTGEAGESARARRTDERHALSMPHAWSRAMTASADLPQPLATGRDAGAALAAASHAVAPRAGDPGRTSWEDARISPATSTQFAEPLATGPAGSIRDSGDAHGTAARPPVRTTANAGTLESSATRHAAATLAPPARIAPPQRPAPDVHITIDRLEVAPPAPIPRAVAPARSSALSLRAYLAARRSGLP